MAMHERNTYLLSVGEHGEERLAILNALFEITSRDLLLQAGLCRGQKVLEIGCGTGSMTAWIAEQVGPTGHVFAIDNSEKQLDIARKKTEALSNITYIEKSILGFAESDDFDLIYSRFVIMHLQESYRALELLQRLLKPKGYLVCEEASNAVVCCYPSSLVFQKHRQLLLDLAEVNGLDFNFGEKIYSYFHKLHFDDIFVHFIQPIFRNKAQKKIIPLLVEELGERYIQSGLARKKEIYQLLKDLYQFIEDERFLVSFARTTQIYGQLK